MDFFRISSSTIICSGALYRTPKTFAQAFFAGFPSPNATRALNPLRSLKGEISFGRQGHEIWWDNLSLQWKLHPCIGFHRLQDRAYHLNRAGAVLSGYQRRGVLAQAVHKIMLPVPLYVGDQRGRTVVYANDRSFDGLGTGGWFSGIPERILYGSKVGLGRVGTSMNTRVII